MFEKLSQWLNKRSLSKEALTFSGVLLFIMLVIYYFGEILVPVLAAIVFAFLLESIVHFMEIKFKFKRIIAVYIVFLFAMSIFVAILFWLLPLVAEQLTELVKNLPKNIESLHTKALSFSALHHNIISSKQINDLFSMFSDIDIDKLTGLGGSIISYSLSSLTMVFKTLVYLFLVPMLVLFFMKDKETIMNWLISVSPKDLGGVRYVWSSLKPQLANYVKGKFLEATIVGVATYFGFLFFDLNYAILLAFFVALSVFIPYIGMVLVTIPVMIIGIMQFGFCSEFFYMIIVYMVIQALDGNVLVPFLYSEAVNLHPVAVIVSVLFFGGIMGFWGLFFAIPLGAFLNAIIKFWISEQKLKLLENQN